MAKEPDFDTFEEEIAYYERRRQDRRSAARAALATTPAAILETARRGADVFRELVIVTPDTHPDRSGPIRITSFLEDGPWGHENVKTMDEAAERLAEKSWDTLTPAFDDEVIAWTSTPKFQRGSQAAALIQAGNALRYRAAGNAAKDAAGKLEMQAHELFQSDPEAAIRLLEDALRRQGEPVPNPPYTTRLTENPPWVSRVLANNFDLMSSQVKNAWMPRLEDVHAGPRGAVIAHMNELGCGAYGCVLPTGDPKVVLKVTTDVTEAEFAAQFANELVAPICVHYHTVMRLAARHQKQPIHLLWRDAADHVGKMGEVLGPAAVLLCDQQQKLGADAYDAFYRQRAEAVIAQGVHAWLDFLDRHAHLAKRPQIAESKADWQGRAVIGAVFAGIAKVFREQHILFGDLHSGNFGEVDGRWIIVDPGNVAVLEDGFF